MNTTRFAAFNTSLYRDNEGDLIVDLSTPDNPQARAVAEIIQRTRPDVLLINEFDYDARGEAVTLFQENYLSHSQNGAEPLKYPDYFVAPSNTGIPSGRDFNKDGDIGVPEDAFGFGLFPGQYGMALYSMHPIQYDRIRTFQYFLWKDMPGGMLPIDPGTGESWYDEGDLAIFRLSSKSYWDVPILVRGRTVHLLASHPTPPVFDGPERRNGMRNHDEIRFWADYIDPALSRYIYDDNGQLGGLQEQQLFVIASDQNADPYDGGSIPGSIQQLLDNPLVNTSVTPSNKGGPEAALLHPEANDSHKGDPAFDTAAFSESVTGNLRIDYVLPSRTLRIRDAGVFWPTTDNPLFYLTGIFPFPSSDHRLVWIDVQMPPARNR